MKKIKYFNKVLIQSESAQEPEYELKSLEYDTTDKEFEYWLTFIKKTYGKFGDITYIEVEENKTNITDLQQEAISSLIKEQAQLKIELNNQKEFNANLLKEFAQLGGNINV